MSDKKHRWVKVAETEKEISFSNNGIAEINADGKMICMAKHEEKFYAFAQKCPHAGGPFVEGYMDALGNIVCPLHRYKFCPSNGRNISGEGYYLKHWPVEVREDGVYIGFETNKLFGLF